MSDYATQNRFEKLDHRRSIEKQSPRSHQLRHQLLNILFDLDGFPLYVATSKPHFYARKIIKHFELNEFFAEVYGSELDGRRIEKADLIQYILEEISASPEQCLMIGDRKFDLIGALKNNVPGIGVLWGYGSREELSAVESLALHQNLEELTRYILELSRLS